MRVAALVTSGVKNQYVMSARVSIGRRRTVARAGWMRSISQNTAESTASPATSERMEGAGRKSRGWRGGSGAREPTGNLLACPAMIVVQVHDERRQKNTFAAALGGTRLHGIKTIEEPVEVARRSLAARLARQTVHRFVGGAERARRATSLVVVAERLIGTTRHAVADELCQLTLAVMLARRLLRVVGV